MTAELLAVPVPARVSVLTCDATELRLATDALYVAELALSTSGSTLEIVCESGEHPGRTADVAFAAGLGLLRLVAPALRIDGGAAESEEQELVITTGAQIHLIQILPDAEDPRVLYVVLRRDRGTVVQARHVLARHLAPRAGRPRHLADVPAPSCTPVVPLTRPALRRHTTSVRPAARSARRTSDLRVATTPAAVPAPGGWSSDDQTLRRVLAGLRSMT